MRIGRPWLVATLATFFGVAIALNACSTAAQGSIMNSISIDRTVDLPDLGPAPELTNSIWLNTDSPLRLADLRGKVVGRGNVDLRLHQLPARHSISEDLVRPVQGSGLRA